LNNRETEISIRNIHDYWIQSSVPVVHCGAHLAEELEEYLDVGWNDITWIEANPDLIPRLKARVKEISFSKVLNAALWSLDGKALELKVANNSYSSSFLNFGLHAEIYPEINFEKVIKVKTVTLDSLFENQETYSKAFLVLDLQGSELEALKGATNFLNHFDYVYTEVSKGNLYESQGKWTEITNFLANQDFKLVDWQYSKKLNWGNALYQRNGKSRKILKTRFLRKMHQKLIQITNQ
jgi:FkbM family methyltransferase